MSEKSRIHLIGNAHLDPIWLWRWQEGCGEVLQTFRSALDRLNEYPDFVFTCSSAAYYKWVEEIAPDMFEEIVEKVKEGRWVPVNGWFSLTVTCRRARALPVRHFIHSFITMKNSAKFAVRRITSTLSDIRATCRSLLKTAV